jgi:hypothetical protein
VPTSLSTAFLASTEQPRKFLTAQKIDISSGKERSTLCPSLITPTAWCRFSQLRTAPPVHARS